MPGIFSLECMETDNSYFGASAYPDQALEAVVRLLDRNQCFNSSLQEEWNQYGKEAFHMGVSEETDSTDPADLQDMIDDWKEIFESVEFLGLLDEQGKQEEGDHRGL